MIKAMTLQEFTKSNPDDEKRQLLKGVLSDVNRLLQESKQKMESSKEMSKEEFDKSVEQLNALKDKLFKDLNKKE